jgi:hypothetical protein
MILKRIEKNNEIKAIYDSSNIIASIFNTETNELQLIFKSGIKYKYPNVSKSDYMRLETADSQGVIFNTHIKKYVFEKLGNVDISKILDEGKSIREQEFEVELNAKKERMFKTMKGIVLLIDGERPFDDVLDKLKLEIDEYVNKLKEKI